MSICGRWSGRYTGPVTAVVVAMLVMPAVRASAANPEPAQPPRATTDQAQSEEQSWRLSELTGRAVLDADSNQIGKVTDIVLTGEGGLRVLVSTEGFLGDGNSSVAIPFSALAIRADGKALRIKNTASTLNSLPKLAPAVGLADERADADQ